MVPCDFCKAPEAKFKCSACKCNYYCNQTCASNHWKKGHKADCKFLSNHIAEFNSEDKKISSSITKLEEAHSSKQECCICLDVLVRETSFILSCQHILCDECVFGQLNNADAKICPLCRTPLPTSSNIFQYMYEVGVKFVQRANRLPRGSPERMPLCQSARYQRQKIIEYLTIGREYGFGGNFEFLMSIFDVEISVAEGLAEDAITKANPLIVQARGMNDKMMQINLHCQVGTSYILLEDFVEAEKAYSAAFLLCTRNNSKETREIFHQLSRCYYESGEYGKSIEIGEAAIVQNRHYDGVYEYVAKSHLALGELISAVDVMRRSVAYETPWDEKNVKKAKDFLAELIAKLENTVW